VTMEFGCHLPVYGPAATRETLLAFARRMEALGYDSLWASDHVVIPWRIASKYPYNETGDFPLPASANFLEPLTTLALVAGAPERGRARGRLARRVHERREDEGGARRAGGGVPRGRTRGEVPHAQRAPGPARPARRRGPRPRDPRAGRARCASPRPRIARARSRGHDRDLRALHPRRPREALGPCRIRPCSRLNARLSSPAKLCFESPLVYRLILPIAPRTSSRWTLESRGMDGFFEDRLPKSRLDRLTEDEVHRAPEQPL